MNIEDQSRTRLIDSGGRIHDFRLYRELKSPGHRLSDEKFVEYAVKNLGHVVIRSIDGRMRLQARPRSVSGVTMTQLMYVLAQERPSATVLMTLDAIDMQWTHHVLGSWDHAIGRLNEMLRPGMAADGIDVVRHSLDSLSASSPLRWAIELWSEHATSFSPNLIKPRARDQTLRFTLYQRTGRSDAFHLVDASTGFPSEVQRCLDRLVGFDVRDRPDFAYGQMCHNAYTKVIGSDQPVLETVQGTMRWRKLEVSAHHYNRLLLPLHDEAGTSWILSATVAENVPLVLSDASVEHGQVGRDGIWRSAK